LPKKQNDSQFLDREDVKRALQLYKQDYKLTTIADELGISTSTLRRWLRKAGFGPKNDSYGSNPDTEKEKSVDPIQESLDEDLNKKTKEAINVAKREARTAEEKNILEISEAQTSPAEKYQTYVAAAGMRLLRDSMSNLRPPKTIRELDQLDQMIRRNLGLNDKKGGGAGKMQIDISILNNARANKSKNAIKINQEDIVDVEPEKPKD
jgi:transposase-like protein|tara:strand:+ start:174 stop:797 length:624 start_codon:yes stop_codon:yes gene_type:complete